jgi:type IV pilus assembly protein PilV
MLTSRRRRQDRPEGITLLESLVSLMILALAVLGMLAVQIRTLAEMQTGVRRAQAVRLVEDLGERIKSNPAGYAELASYVTGWNATPTASVDCSRTACNATDQAKWDVANWKLRVADALPLGNAELFYSADEDSPRRRQLGVLVGWRANERTHDAAMRMALQSGIAEAGTTCPAGLICHLAYVQP